MATVPDSNPAATATAPAKAAVAEGRKPRGGRVFINEERCKGCGLCIALCPSHVLERSSRFNTKGYHPPEAVKPESCTGCDICGHVCPDFAIFGVRNVEKKEGAQPDADAEK